MNNLLPKRNLFSLATIVFLIIMPFYVLTKVYFEHKLGIPHFGFFLKEGLLVLLGGLLIWEFIKNKKLPQINYLDILIVAYVLYGIGITLYNGLGLGHIIHGGRYDFFFFYVFLLYKHGSQFLTFSKQEIIKFFLYSASLSLFFGVLVKFIFGEARLMYFGYSDYSSYWTFQGAVPIYHGLEGAGVRRFQGLLEGPNAMGFFLIAYTSLVLYIQKQKFQFHNILFVIFMLWLVLLTYSRSALLGIGVAGVSVFFLHIKFIYHKLKKHLLALILLFTIIFGGLIFLFQEKIYHAVVRPGSTTGHFERMEIGIDRFIEKPLGSGLATSGPGFRNVFDGEITQKIEEYYIPESWFIQQLTEGGYIYFSLFVLILLSISYQLHRKHSMLFAGLIAVLVMNVFLHIFESTHMSYAYFALIAIALYKKSETE